MVTREEIRLAYLFLLNREPESEDCYDHHAPLDDVAALRQSILQGPEAMWRLRVDLREVRELGTFHYFKPQIVFIHLEKVGGTSLHDSLVTQFASMRPSLPHLNCIPDCTVAELNDYDLVSGHFSYQEAMALPRSPKTFIILFREPFARLISFYRFHRAHPEELRCNPVVDLAKTLSPVEFFRHPDIRSSPRINNAYLQCLTGFPGRGEPVEREAMNDALETAYQRLGEIPAIGLTEDMSNTIRLINDVTGFSIPSQMGRVNSTEDLHREQAGFSAPDEVNLSAALREVLAPLVEHDREIYARAAELFRSRLAKLNAPQSLAATPVATPLSLLRRTAAQARAAVLARRQAQPAPLRPPV